MKKYVAELLGTFFLILIAGLSGDPLAIGAGFAILVYATGPLSGGYLNPAVTLSLVVAKKIKMAEAINYWIAQLLGALIGALVYWLLRGTTMSIMPLDGIALWKVGVGEFIFTFLLALVVYMTTVYKKAETQSYRGLAIGLTVFIAIVSVGRMTGGAFNPALATGAIFVDRVHGGGSGMYLWLYLLATLLAGFAAGHVATGLKNTDQ